MDNSNTKRRRNERSASPTSSTRRSRSRDVMPNELKDMKILSSNDEAVHVSRKDKISESSTSSNKRTRTSQDVMPNEDMKMLSSNDEAFYVSVFDIIDIKNLINAREVPARETLLKWDEYTKSFYLKMCLCFGDDSQPLKVASNDDEYVEQEAHILSPKLEPKETPLELHKEDRLENIFRMFKLRGPYRFGSYSPGTKPRPDRVPYHLYLLVKKVADIMEQNNNTGELTILEKKIDFFCNYFYCHLPRDWEYDRNKARSLIAGYDPTRKPRYCMDGYTPKSVYKYTMDYDVKSNLTQFNMADIMNIIHSRKRPSFRDMYACSLSFYCKLCSCFGIDYHRLDEASEDDVCLMNVGGKPTLIRSK